jgi:hypothetical protein
LHEIAYDPTATKMPMSASSALPFADNDQPAPKESNTVDMRLATALRRDSNAQLWFLKSNFCRHRFPSEGRRRLWGHQALFDHLVGDGE